MKFLYIKNTSNLKINFYDLQESNKEVCKSICCRFSDLSEAAREAEKNVRKKKKLKYKLKFRHMLIIKIWNIIVKFFMMYARKYLHCFA